MLTGMGRCVEGIDKTDKYGFSNKFPGDRT